jgi:hypothetical protein
MYRKGSSPMPYERTARIDEWLHETAIRRAMLTDDIDTLATFARTAFVLGMVDAFEHRTMKDSFDVMRHLCPHGWDGKRFHRTKFRQVYGAGYDMAQGWLGVPLTEQRETMASVVIVNDGDTLWGASRDTLFAAMKMLGWVREPGGVWIEPERPDDDETQSAYLRLCELVKPLPGFDGAAGDRPDWDLFPSLTYQPDLGRRHWSLG